MKNISFLVLIIGLLSCNTNQNQGKSIVGMCDNFNPDISPLKKFDIHRENSISKFANSKLIAENGDKMLSQLIKGKSKVLQSWMIRKNLFNESETKIAQEWRIYFAKNFIIAKYPLKDSKTNRSIESFMDALYSDAFTKERKAKFEILFTTAKNKAIELIKAFKLTKDQEVEAVNRVGKIKLYWMEQFKSSKFKQYPLELLSWGIAYDPENNEINMGMEALDYQTDANIFTVFAHEIGHSLDSCRWGYYMKSKDPFQEVAKCLRDEKGAYAKFRDDAILEELFKKKQIPLASYTMFKAHNTCNKSFYPPVGVQADQLPEAFADWFSAEILAKSDYAKKKFRLDLCHSYKLQKGSSYLSNKDRLYKIYLSHPSLQKSFKNPNPSIYCKFNK